MIGFPAGDEFQPFLNLHMICHLNGDKTLDGVLQRSGPQFLVLRNEAVHLTYLINKTQIVVVEIKQDQPVVLRD